MENRKAEVTVDPSLFSMVARTMYSSDPTIIVPRELLQNSVDACKRAGVIPEISMIIETHWSSTEGESWTSIVCEDNGCGMDQDELVDKFLKLGASSKRGDSQSTGKFGIAKAAIMSGKDWSVETNEIAVSFEDVREGNLVRDLPEPRVGTRVYVMLDRYCYSKQTIVRLIESSEVDIKLILTERSDTCYNIEHCGLLVNPQNEVVLVEDKLWKGTSIEKLPSNEADGYTFVRLNGLTQFELKGHCSERETNLLIDMFPSTADPGNDEYPFTMSRENLRGSSKDKIDSWVDECNRNPYTTDSLREDLTNQEKQNFIPGYSLRGKRSRLHGGTEEQDNDQDNIRDSKIVDALRKIKNYPYGTDAMKFIDENAISPIIRLDRYTVTDETFPRDSKIMQAWAMMLTYVVDNEIKFGVGLIGASLTTSQLDTSSGMYFFSINPGFVCFEKTPFGRALAMWGMASHEASHLHIQNHNESFTMAELMVQHESADDIYPIVAKVARILSGPEFF
jgi:hypothetical protein